MWLSTKESLEYLKKRGRTITKSGLKYLGMVNKFYRKHKDGFHSEYDTAGLDKILEEVIIPDGSITMKDFSDRYGIPMSTVYGELISNDIHREKYNGVYYFSEKELLNSIDGGKDGKKKN